MNGEEVKALGGWKAQSAVAEYVCNAKQAELEGVKTNVKEECTHLNTTMMQRSARDSQVALNKKGQHKTETTGRFWTSLKRINRRTTN